MPPLSADEVVDYMVMEALALKSADQSVEADRAAEREAWKKAPPESWAKDAL